MKFNIIKNTKIDNTPFTILTNEESKSMIAVGNQIVSQPKETEDECIKLIENRDWELILNASYAFNKLVNDFENEEKNETQDEKNSN